MIFSDKYKIVFAEITTWQGISIGAEHYYLKMVWWDGAKHESEDIEDTLTAANAKKLNKRELSKAPEYRYRYTKGMKIRGFWTEAEAEKAALAWIETNMPDCDILLTGDSSASASVSRCLKHSDPSAMEDINRLYTVADKLDFYEHKKNYKAMEQIDSEFYRLVEAKQ